MELIPIEYRNKYKCRQCGETRSVKYFIETVDPLEGSEPFYAPYCNKCALMCINNINEEETKMNEPKWKLNEDIHPNDRILDPVTFQQVIDALHCNERVIDQKAVERVTREILESRLQDFYYLIENNMQEIIAEAAKGRNK